MNRLYQWLHDRAITLRAETVTRSEQRTVRTEITMREQERTVLVSGGNTLDGASCPLCGRLFESGAQADQATPFQSGPHPHASAFPALQPKLQTLKKRPARKSTGR